MDEWNPAIKPLPGRVYSATAGQIEEYMKSLEIEKDMKDYNPVTKPKHYMLFEDLGIEVRDVIEKLTQKFELSSMGHSYMFVSDYVQMMQYLMRFMDKNGVEDLKKARWYLDKMIETD